MIHNYYFISLIFLAGFILFSVINHFTAKQPGQLHRVHLLFAVIAFLFAFGSLSNVIKLNTTALADHITWERVNISFNILIYTLLPWFFALYSGVRARPLLVGVSALCALLFFINLIQPNTLLYSEIHGINRLVLPWSEEVFLLKATPGIWGIIATVYLLLIPIFGFYVLFRRFRRDRRRSTLSMMFAVALLWAASIQAVFVRVIGFHDLPPMGPYGYLSMAIIMGLTLTREQQKDRKRAEEALQQSERKARAILDQGFVFIGLMSLDGILLDANRTSLKLAGVTPADVLNKPFWESPWWNHSTELQNKLRESIRLAAAGEEVRFEASHPAIDGSLRYVDFSLRPVKNEQGDIAYLIPEGHDITERKHAEENLKESQRKLSTLMGNLPGIAYRCINNPNWTMAFMSEGCFKLTGFYPQELEGNQLNSFGNLIHSDDAQMVWQKVQEGLNNHTFWQIEYRIHTKEGIEKWVWEQGCGIFNDAGELDVLEGFISDITERKKTEEALTISEEKYRYIVDNAPIGIFQRSIQGSFNFCNLTLVKQFECNSIDEFYLNYNDITKRWPNREQFIAFNELLLKNGEVLGFENELKLINGKTKWFSLYYKLDSTKSILDGFSLDITERKLAEQSLKESEERYKLLINNIMYPVIVSSFDGKMLYINQKTADFLGVEPSDIQNLKSPNFWVDPTKRDEFIAELKTNSVVRNKEVQFRNTNNEMITAVMSSNIIDYFGQKAIFSIYNDISQRKKAEKALQESEEKYRYIVENAPIGIYKRKMEEQFNYCNITLAKQFECNTIDEFSQHYGEVSKRFVTIDKYAEYKELLKKNGKTLGYEVETKLINGKTKWFSLYSFVDILNDEINGFSLDITERKLAERALNSLATNFAGLSGKAFFEAVSKHIATEMGIDYVYVGELTDTKDSVCVLGGFALGEAMGEMLYSLSDTPCSDVIENDTCIYPNGIQQLYPKDDLLQEMGIESYLGFRIYSKEQEPIGLLVALHSKPFNNTDILVNLFSIFLDRIAAELHRVHAYETLHKNEAIQRKMVSNIGDVIVVIDKNGINRYKSLNIEKWFGWKPEEVVGKSTWDNVHPDDLIMGQNFIASIINEPNATGTIELRYRKKDDSYCWIEITIINLLHDPDICGLLGNYHDITERKQKEDQLRKLSQAVEQSPVSIVITDLDGNIDYVNPKFTQLTGYTITEALGQNPRILKSGEHEPAYYMELWQTISSGKDWRGELHNKKKNGEFYWESASISPIINNKGEITHYLAVKKDITEEKKAEQELISAKEKVELRTAELNEINKQLEENIIDLFEAKRRAEESEQRYKILVDTMMYPVMVTTLNGEILFANTQAFDFFDFSEQDIYLKNISDFYIDAEKRADFVSQLQTVGVVRNMEIMLNCKNQVVTVKVSSVMFEYYGRNTILSIFNDITKQKELEQQVLSIAIDTEEKERLHFAQELHDGLAPLLSAAKMYLQWVQQIENPKEIPEYANKALALIDDSYKTAREISHMLSPHVLQTHGLLQALKNVTEKIEGTKIKKINLSYLCEDINNCFVNYSIQKQTIIYRVLLECINNTIKHANASEININFIRQDKTNDLLISYSDNGIGFDTETVYTQSKGLGLLNIKNRINWINGSFSITSKKNKGVLIEINVKP